VDLQNKEVTGKQAEQLLERCGITVNKNMVPFDPRPPAVSSGIRIGTPAVTSRGMKEPEMRVIARLIDRVLSHPDDERTLAEVRASVLELTEAFPLYDDLPRYTEL
jgi:glycine hydroxymethyltransferase